MQTLRERESSSRAVKVSQEAKQVVKKASIKTKK
jgi:hypothetical protein